VAQLVKALWPVRRIAASFNTRQAGLSVLRELPMGRTDGAAKDQAARTASRFCRAPILMAMLASIPGVLLAGS
jgi:hypothetical protein